MPWTFAHPAAVLPFRFYSRKLPWSALVVGSLSPDLGYYCGQFEMATVAHSLPGILLVCIPMGVVCCLLLQQLKPALCFLLPQPHRDALSTLEAERWQWIPIGAGLGIGALTHVLWDGFTHTSGLFVELIPALASPLQIAGFNLPYCKWLQHLSSLLGTVLLWRAYRDWLARRRGHSTPLIVEAPWRGPLWLSLAGLATAITLALLLRDNAPAMTHFRLATVGTSIFAGLVVLAAVAIDQARQSRPK